MTPDERLIAELRARDGCGSDLKSCRENWPSDPAGWCRGCVDRAVADELGRFQEELEKARVWINDLQSGMYVNCVYCGHRYGPGETTPVTMADALKAHVEQCPQHPMSALKAENRTLKALVAALEAREQRAEKAEQELEKAQQYLTHKRDCAKWGEVWEWPRYLHGDIDCTCGRAALTAAPSKDQR